MTCDGEEAMAPTGKETREVAIGVILPDDGPFDYEWLRLDPWLAQAGLQPVRCLVGRSPADGIMTPKRLAAIGSLGVLCPVARVLAARGASVLLWACTSGSFIRGHEAARRQVAGLGAATGLPATSTSIAMAEAAKSMGATKVDLLSAYSKTVTDRLTGFLAEAGLMVGRIRTLGCIESHESVAVDIVAEVDRLAREDGAPADRPLLVPDTAINTLALLPELSRLAGRRVITANQASLWHALVRAGLPQEAQRAVLDPVGTRAAA